MFWFKKKEYFGSDSDSELAGDDKSARLFFHDLVNLTHGLILFLSQRQSSKLGLSSEEVQLLEKEIRTLQSLIKDHFQFKHKNLAPTLEWVPFYFAESAVKNLVLTYLPKNSVQTYFHKNFLENELTLVYYPFFYRIMNNLIKNMSEAKSSEVHLTFNYDEFGLSIETKNQSRGSGELSALSDNIGLVILNELPVNKHVSLGLESIHHLTLECGGTFEFEISNGFWINRITLPKRGQITHQKEQKKAA